MEFVTLIREDEMEIKDSTRSEAIRKRYLFVIH